MSDYLDSQVIDYEKLLQEAMYDVVKKVMSIAAQRGLPGPHHFCITFMTQHSGVKISQSMLAQYPEELSIVIQNQFENLKVQSDCFEVSLIFGGINEHLVIPFSSIIFFADPSVSFALEFQDATQHSLEEEEALHSGEKTRSQGSSESQKDSRVISLDKYR